MLASLVPMISRVEQESFVSMELVCLGTVGHAVIVRKAKSVALVNAHLVLSRQIVTPARCVPKELV